MTPKNVLNQMEESLKRFGTHNFDDKGPSEVMNISSISTHLKSVSKEEAVEFIKEIVDSQGYFDRNKKVANEILVYCDDMPYEWFEYVLVNSGAEY